MDRLWTPWRWQFIVGPKPKDQCFMCDALNAPPAADREHFVVYRGRHAFVMMNAFPYNNGDVLIVPHAHESDLSRLTSETRDELMSLVTRAIDWLKQSAKPQGFNVGINLGEVAGAGMKDHLHFHVVPRWTGDTSFLTIIGETRTLPQWLDETWLSLRKVIEAEEV